MPTPTTDPTATAMPSDRLSVRCRWDAAPGGGADVDEEAGGQEDDGKPRDDGGCDEDGGRDECGDREEGGGRPLEVMIVPSGAGQAPGS
jgi:hypothetical protein